MDIKKQLNFVREFNLLKDSTPVGFEAWHKYEDVLNFMQMEVGDDVPIYVSAPGFFIYSLVVPNTNFGDHYRTDLLNWSVSMMHQYGFPHDGIFDLHAINDLVDHAGCDTLRNSIPIYFLRGMEGYEPLSSYVEINQKVSHVLGLHWIGEKGAWGKFDDTGKIVPVARYDRDDKFKFCSLRREELDFFLFRTSSSLVRCFDFHRGNVMDGPRADHRDQFSNTATDIYAKRCVARDKENRTVFSLLRGFQVLRCRNPDEMAKKHRGEEDRKYESFLIHDFKHNEVREWSCDPKQLGNYFVESDLPFETSPAFFAPEVLDQYKQDPERFAIKERQIVCRGSWSLRFDVNDAGQVHAYICDLNLLPHIEQLHWKAFNEKPKAGISARAIKTDFLAQWDLDIEPLTKLKELLKKFPSKDKDDTDCILWQMPNVPKSRSLDFLNYVITDSRKEWEDQILALAQIVCEGLDGNLINTVANRRGCHEEKLGSIKKLRWVLQNGNLPDAVDIVAPLIEIWDLRSSVVAHAGNKLPTHDLQNHYRTLIEKTAATFNRLATLVVDGFFTR